MTKHIINGIVFNVTSKGAFLAKNPTEVNVFSSEFLEALNQLKAENKRLAKKYETPAYVYIGAGRLKLGDKPLYKIGSSYYPYRRLENDCERILFTIPTKNRVLAYEPEYKLHAQYITKATRFSEWFALSDDDLNYIRQLAQKG